jgi:hypothetical protein
MRFVFVSSQGEGQYNLSQSALSSSGPVVSSLQGLFSFLGQHRFQVGQSPGFREFSAFCIIDWIFRRYWSQEPTAMEMYRRHSATIASTTVLSLYHTSLPLALTFSVSHNGYNVVLLRAYGSYSQWSFRNNITYAAPISPSQGF